MSERILTDLLCRAISCIHLLIMRLQIANTISLTVVQIKGGGTQLRTNQPKAVFLKLFPG